MSESYPKWLYSPTEDALIVPDEEARAALGPGWYESPADFPKAAEPKKTPPPLPVNSEADEPVKPHKKGK